MPNTETGGADPGALVVSLFPVLFWVLALACAGIAILRGPRPVTPSFAIDRLLRYLFLFPLGLQGLWVFFCQVFLPEETANAIGWEPSPFQFEVGVANLGLGLASLYAAFAGFGARAAIAIVAACFLGGAGVGHLIDISLGDNLTAGNAGPILYTDFLTPIAVLALLLLSPRRNEERVAEAPAKVEPVRAKAPSPVKSEAAPVKMDAAPIKPVETTPNAVSPSRIEDELETARKSMRESLRAGPKPEVLAPQRSSDSGPRKSPRRKYLPEAQD